MSDHWQQSYEAWLDERDTYWLSRDLDEDECPICGADIDPKVRHCYSCMEEV